MSGALQAATVVDDEIVDLLTSQLAAAVQIPREILMGEGTPFTPEVGIDVGIFLRNTDEARNRIAKRLSAAMRSLLT